MSQYEEARAAYWETQSLFRARAVEEIRLNMPEGVETVVLDINDTPRLSVHDLLDAAGESVLDDYNNEYDVLDQIASDMEAFNWDEADSFLDGDGDGRFVVQR